MNSTLMINACEAVSGNCMNCFHADRCPMYLDEAPYTPAQIPVKCVRLALFESRHKIPVHGSIFPHSVDPADSLKIKALCKKSLDEKLVGKYLVTYVTGLTKALVEVINYCHKNKINLVLMHYNPVTGEYEPQEVD